MQYQQVTLKSTSQALTASYADLGSEINCLGYKTLRVFADIDINDSQNVTFAVLGKLTENATAEYNLGQQVSSTAKYTVDAEVFEINTDADQKICVKVDVTGLQFAQVQVKAGTAGAGPGAILSSYAVLCD
jgi:hypothetical protein